MICYSDLEEISRMYRAEYLMHCQRRQEKLTCYIMESLKEKRAVDTMTVFKLGTSETLEVRLRKDDNIYNFYTSHYGVPVLVQKDRYKVTEIACNSRRVLDLISEYPKYSEAGQNNIEIETHFVIKEFSEYKGALSMDGEKVSIAGLIGTISDDPSVHMDLSVKKDDLTEVDAKLLKTYVEKKDLFDGSCTNAIVNDNRMMPRMIRSALYHINKNERKQSFIRSTSEKKNVETPSSKSDGRKLVEEMHNLDLDTFLERITDIVPLDNYGDPLEGEEMVLNDSLAYLEMYGSTDAELIPGVEYLETSKKIRFDNPSCLRSIITMMTYALKNPRTALNETLYSLNQRCKDENKEDGDN